MLEEIVDLPSPVKLGGLYRTIYRCLTTKEFDCRSTRGYPLGEAPYGSGPRGAPIGGGPGALPIQNVNFDGAVWCLVPIESLKPMAAHNPAYDISLLGRLKQVEASKPVPVPLYDGATAAQCLARYKYLQRTDPGTPRPMTPEMKAMGYVAGDKVALTTLQKLKAQEMWRDELRALTKVTETKERDRVRVDLEFEEWE